MRWLGLDLGRKRIGVALSDPQQVLASGLQVIEGGSRQATLQVISKLVTVHQVGGIVVGLPTRMNGTLGEEAQRAQAFAAQLEAQLRIPVVLWDERLTTVRAERLLREGGKRKRRASTDVAAATILLQDYLDSLKAEPL